MKINHTREVAQWLNESGTHGGGRGFESLLWQHNDFKYPPVWLQIYDFWIDINKIVGISAFL